MEEQEHSEIKLASPLSGCLVSVRVRRVGVASAWAQHHVLFGVAKADQAPDPSVCSAASHSSASSALFCPRARPTLRREVRDDRTSRAQFVLRSDFAERSPIEITTLADHRSAERAAPWLGRFRRLGPPQRRPTLGCFWGGAAMRAKPCAAGCALE